VLEHARGENGSFFFEQWGRERERERERERARARARARSNTNLQKLASSEAKTLAHTAAFTPPPPSPLSRSGGERCDRHFMLRCGRSAAGWCLAKPELSGSTLRFPPRIPCSRNNCCLISNPKSPPTGPFLTYQPPPPPPQTATPSLQTPLED
jgi:hypothetical protein